MKRLPLSFSAYRWNGIMAYGDDTPFKNRYIFEKFITELVALAVKIN